MAGDEQSPGMSRRRILIGTAWATLAILIGVGVPQAAASTVVVVDDVLIFNNVTISNGVNGVVDANFGYQLVWESGYPEGQVANSYYQVQVTGPNGDYTSDIGTAPITSGGSVGPLQVTLTDVEPGT